MRRLRWSVAGMMTVAGAFGVLAALVAAGSLTSLDQYAVDHWMPHLVPGGDTLSLTASGQLYPSIGSPLQAFCNVWTFPGSMLASGVLLVVCCIVLVRRARRNAAAVWASAWVLANGLEIIGKSALYRPVLHVVTGGVTLRLTSFDNSFPSGHAVRAIMITALLAFVWRRVAWSLLAWAVAGLPLLVVNANHTPSDVVGGALLALLAVLTVRMWCRRTVARGEAGPVGPVPRVGFQAVVEEQ